MLKGRRGGGEEEGVVVQVDGADDDVVLLVGADVVGEEPGSRGAQGLHCGEDSLGRGIDVKIERSLSKEQTLTQASIHDNRKAFGS